MHTLLVSLVCALSVTQLCSGEPAAEAHPKPDPGPQPSPDPGPKPDPKAQPDPKPDPKAQPEAEPDPFLGFGLTAFLNPVSGVSHHYSHGQGQSCHYHGNLLGVYPHCYSASRFCRLMVARPHLLARLHGLWGYFRKYCRYTHSSHDYGLGFQGGLGHRPGHGYYDDYHYNDYDQGGYIYPDYGIGAYGRAGYGY